MIELSKLLETYDKHDRHTPAVHAVGIMAFNAGKAEALAQIERYPLAQQVKEEREMRLDADRREHRMALELQRVRHQLDTAIATNEALSAELLRVDAKRS